MYIINSKELKEIFDNLNQKENLTYADILSAIQLKYPGLSDQLQSDINSDFLAKDIQTSCTLLVFASQEGHEEIAKLLLEHKEINVDAQDGKGRTALHHAAEWGHAGMVELLLEKEANSLLTNDDGKTPKDLAMSKGYANIVEMLKIKKNHASYPVTNTNSCDKKTNNTRVTMISAAEQNAIVGAVVTVALGVAITIALFAAGGVSWVSVQRSGKISCRQGMPKI